MNASDLFTVGNLAAVIGVLLILVIGTAIYIFINAPKKAKKTAILYDEWTEQLQLPKLTNNADLNSKAIDKFFKLVWPNKFPEELDVRQELSNLTQKLALDFTKAANEELQPKGSPMAFIYDVEDASSGFLRLVSVPIDSREHSLFQLSQGLLLLMREAYPIAEFSHIDLADDVDPENMAELQSFIVTGSGFPTRDSVAGAKVLDTLTAHFDGVWLASQVGKDAILFRRQTDEDLLQDRSIPVESNPFQARIAAKRKAEAEQAARDAVTAAAREAAWRKAEETRKANEVAARDAAIAAGTVSKHVTNPLPFLAAEIEIAADAAELLSLRDAPEILKSDGIGAPIMFAVYSEEVLHEEDARVQNFAKLLNASLATNLGGDWRLEFSETTLTFRRGL
jgi:hypothetical protein